MPNSAPRRTFVWLPGALIALIGVCYLLISSHLPFLGDDLSFYKRTEAYAGANFPLFYKHIAGMWFGSNGRLMNIVVPALFQYTPPVVLWIVNAAAVVLLFWVTIKWCSLRSITARVAVIAVLAFALPWWDMFLLFDVNIGYTGGMGLALLAMWYFFKNEHIKASPLKKMVLTLLALFAGGMHEALGAPLCLSLAVYLWLTKRYKGITSAQWWMIVGLVLGALYCTLAPGIWLRLGGERIVDGSRWWRIIVSSYFPLLLVAVVAVMWIWRKEVVCRLVRTPWSVWAMMAVVSIPIVAIGGIVGRSGFFGQVSAIIALVLLAKESAPELRISRPAAAIATAIITLALILHYVQFTRYQLQMSHEASVAIEGYLNSPDGIVYMDYTDEPDLPWYLLRKTRGVPDDDDFYLCTSLTHWLGTPNRPFTVLPSVLRGVDIDSITADLPAGRGYVTLRIPGSEMPDAAKRRLISTPGAPDSIAVPIPHTHAYYIAPRDSDPSGSY